MRNHHHNSQSIIAALPLANDIQNDIYKIKKYKVPLGCSKDYVNTLKNQLISDTGSVYYALYRADDAKKSNKSSMTTLLILSFYCIYFIFTIY